MKAPSHFAAAMMAMFALSACTKENREDLAPLGGKVEVPATFTSAEANGDILNAGLDGQVHGIGQQQDAPREAMERTITAMPGSALQREGYTDRPPLSWVPDPRHADAVLPLIQERDASPEELSAN